MFQVCLEIRPFPSLPALLIPTSYCLSVINSLLFYKINPLLLGFMLSSCNFCLFFQVCREKYFSIHVIVNLPNGFLSFVEFFFTQSFLYCRISFLLMVVQLFMTDCFSSQVGSLLSIEGTLHIRDPKSKSWKQSNVCLKNGYMSVNKERGVRHFSSQQLLLE